MTNSSELRTGEPHPMAVRAKEWIGRQPPEKLMLWREIMASCALEGNRAAEIALATLNRLIDGEPVSDRYVLGLAWMMREGEDARSKLEDRSSELGDGKEKTGD